MGNQYDRRSSQRYSVRIPCRVICNGVQVKATLVDISEEGLGFVTSMPFLYEGRNVEVVFEVGQLHTDEKDGALHLTLEIRNQFSDSFAKRFGAKLREIPQDYLRYLKNILNKSRCNLLCDVMAKTAV
ncbi:PilZ domain-containing protein [Thiomicrorhabdus xiamenensis]|uniref:PilZ domain-containing protein n=1 Tax=Thiomicrorhabdus xiamenensis TaxID=2739063 RepID=A0A7D4SSJ6_9GAMM|nr:PilZ domain-containing protein [Thiomicrorhabdus xiamenensis]QKI89503.1 PilZ domain-containing protein [Thiomicrorhabdus xiamenensis]